MMASMERPTCYIDLCAYQARGDRVLIVNGDQQRDFPVTDLAQQDPDAFEVFVMELAEHNGIEHVMDTDGDIVTLACWLDR
jgi:hypothetical protein